MREKEEGQTREATKLFIPTRNPQQKKKKKGTPLLSREDRILPFSAFLTFSGPWGEGQREAPKCKRMCIGRAQGRGEDFSWQKPKEETIEEAKIVLENTDISCTTVP